VTQVTDGRRVQLNPIVAILVAFDFLFLVPLGMVLVVNGGDDGDVFLIGSGLVFATAFAAIGAGAIRCNILGRPTVRFASDGMRIGPVVFRWAEIGTVGPARLALVPYLVVAIEEKAVTRLPSLDRWSMRYGPRSPDGVQLWVTEPQLGMSVESAIATADGLRAVE